MRLAAILLISFLYMININAQVISTNKLWGLYYGYPSQVNGAASLPEAKNIWKKFKVVVFADALINGNGDETPDTTHTAYSGTSNIITSLSNQIDFYITSLLDYFT